MLLRGYKFFLLFYRRPFQQAHVGSARRIKGIELNYHARVEGEYPSCDSEVELANLAHKCKTYYEWVVKTAEEKKGEVVGGGYWNQVSIGKLLTGRM
jgi:hypothetical protein